MRPRIEVRTVASAMSSDPTTSVTTSRPSLCSSSRSATGAASATVAMAAASAARVSTAAW